MPRLTPFTGLVRGAKVQATIDRHFSASSKTCPSFGVLVRSKYLWGSVIPLCTPAQTLQRLPMGARLCEVFRDPVCTKIENCVPFQGHMSCQIHYGILSVSDVMAVVALAASATPSQPETTASNGTAVSKRMSTFLDSSTAYLTIVCRVVASTTRRRCSDRQATKSLSHTASRVHHDRFFR